MRAIDKRVERLERGLTDITDLAPHSEPWFAYWENIMARKGLPEWRHIRGMPNSIPLSLTIFAATYMVASATLPPLSQPANTDPIARLDECIHQRFLGARTFGMSRILPNRYHGVVLFQPENAAERQVVADLTRKGYHVAVFLAGRHVLDTPSGFRSQARYGVQGPAFVANITAEVALPDRDALLADSRKAMQSFAAHDEHDSGYDVHEADWVVAMRPLRASNETCVMCHTVGPGTLVRDASRQVKLGDALGVAMYVYRR
jgi:hypothetical protein